MFRTAIEPKPWSDKIGYDSHIVCLGSCFADNIARYLSKSKFRVTASPTGILFNPASIAHSMRLMSSNSPIEESSLIDLGGRFVNYDFHSSISGRSRSEAVGIMTDALTVGGNALKSCNLLIVTLGTAWAYILSETNRVVANCHKQPSSLFERRLLSVAEVVEALECIVALAPQRVVFTLSPVRHIGEGLEDNSLSKAILRVAIAEVCRRHAERAIYFPAYEIMMDDLRDYRFYADDMTHPSEMAVDYIAEKFFEVAVSNKDRMLMSRVAKIMQAVDHRPFNAASEGYKEFCRLQLMAIDELKEVDLSEEKAYFERMLQINL